jgi:Glycosyltransferase family 87
VLTVRHASRALIVALLALAVAPAGAHAAARQLDRRQVIAIAGTSPQVAAILRANPGAHWEVVYSRPQRAWTAVLEAAGKHTVLATVRVGDASSSVLSSRVASSTGPPRLSPDQAKTLAGRSQAISDWVRQYPGVTSDATLGDDRVWTVRYLDRGGDDIAEARIDDGAMELIGTRTGPQVGWQLARGEPGSYGRLANRWWIFLPLCLLFAGGLLDWRRPVSMRTLDLLALLSFGVSLHWFNQGNLFVSTPLIYPPLIYLLVRLVWVGSTQPLRRVEIGPTHALILVALTFALVGFRLGLNNRDSNILDVGYAGVVGGDRLLHGTDPYGHMPVKTARPCHGRYANGDPIAYVQSTSGRCESAIESGDTYGPMVYVAYVPFVAALGWSGLWDDLPAAHVASSAFDLLAMAGLFVAGWRLRSARIGVLLAFAWAANPFTLYTLNMNTNDALVGALMAWFMAALSLPFVRGVLLAAAAMTKLGPFALVPLAASLRRRWLTAAGFAAGLLALLSLVVLDGFDGLRLFYERTLHFQLDRVTPLSIWTIGAFHPGWPHLHWLQQALQVAVVIGCTLLAGLPRHRKDAAAVAALGGAALVATQMASSYWFYPYICWWLPLALLAILLPREPAHREPAPLFTPR